jgi:hypothetical protein
VIWLMVDLEWRLDVWLPVFLEPWFHYVWNLLKMLNISVRIVLPWEMWIDGRWVYDCQV